jgi:thiamine pyrophosphate-dependent acetolactate synthase large subunit-like protein
MRELAMRFLNGELSRRGFLKGLMATGFSLTAARSVLDSFRTYNAEAQEIPPAQRKTITADTGEIIAEGLVAAKVKYVFNCNGSAQGPVIDALVEKPIQIICGPQEGQVLAMAHGYELASGETGFVLCEEIGIPNSTSNLYNAWKDRSSLVVMTPRAALETNGRDSFEDIDEWLDIVKPITKWRWSASYAHRIPEHMRQAFKLASTPPRGPVFLTVPSDLLGKKNVKATIVGQEYFHVPMKVKPDPKQIETAARMLVESKAPLIVAGHEITRSKANEDLLKLGELLGIPVARERGLFVNFPTQHPLYLGDLLPNMRFPRNLDLVLNLGGQFPRMSGQYEEDHLPYFPEQVRVIHARVEADDMARLFPTHLSIAGDVGETIRDLMAAVRSMLTPDRIEAIRRPRSEAATKFTTMVRESWRKAPKGKWDKSPMPWERVAYELDQALDKDAVIVQEIADNKKMEQWMKAGGEGERTIIGRTTGQAMGWGVGASLGVKLAWPDRQLVALEGDGSVLFGQTESLWSVSRYSVPEIILIFNNRSYDGPRRRQFDKRGKQAQLNKDMTCYLGNPDVNFAQMASAYNIRGEVAHDATELQAALKRAIKTTRDGRPYLIDAMIERTGPAADLAWHPPFTVAGIRTRNV